MATMADDEKTPAVSPDRAAGVQHAALDWARMAYAEAENACGGNRLRLSEFLLEQSEVASQASQMMTRMALIALLPKRQIRPKA
jgi:hypothetical protein